MKRATRRATIATALAIAILGGQHRYVLARQARAKAQYEAHRAQIDADLAAFQDAFDVWRQESAAGLLRGGPSSALPPPPPWPFPPPPPVV